MAARPGPTDTSGPHKPPIFYMLLALAAGDTYGYALMQAVREASNGHVVLSPGSFYRYAPFPQPLRRGDALRVQPRL